MPSRQFYLLRLIRWVFVVICGAPSLAISQPMQIAMQEQFRLYGALFEMLVKEAGFTPHIEYFPTERSMQMLLAGRVDAEPFRSKEALGDLADKVGWVGPVACSELQAFTRSDSNVTIRSLQDLAGKRILIPLGTRIAKNLTTKYSADVQEIANAESRYKMLNNNYADVVVDSAGIGYQTIRSLQLENRIGPSGVLLTSEPAYFVIRRDVETFTPSLDKTFKAMVKSGRWQRMFNDITVNTRKLPKDIGLHCLPPVD